MDVHPNSIDRRCEAPRPALDATSPPAATARGASDRGSTGLGLNGKRIRDGFAFDRVVGGYPP